MAVREKTIRSGKLLEVAQIESGYGRTRVLKGIDLALYEGEVVSVVGPNGAGKTTLLNTISGLASLHGGEIRFAGEIITRKPAYRIARMGIGHCPEGRRIFQRLTVEENLSTGFIAGEDEATPSCAARRSSCFPSSMSAAPSSPAGCPAGNSRCWRSPEA